MEAQPRTLEQPVAKVDAIESGLGKVRDFERATILGVRFRLGGWNSASDESTDRQLVLNIEIEEPIGPDDVISSVVQLYDILPNLDRGDPQFSLIAESKVVSYGRMRVTLRPAPSAKANFAEILRLGIDGQAFLTLRSRSGK